MEGVPRIPMLSFQARRSADTPSFRSQIAKSIMAHYGEDANSYSKEIHELESLRGGAVHPTRDICGCAILKKYYCQLHSLKSRFPLNEDSPYPITFSWYDVFAEQVHSWSDIDFEISSILYNIGSLHSEVAGLDARTTVDDMKNCVTHYQCAAWAFDHLRSNFQKFFTPDLSADLLGLMSTLCLAQAQECVVEKSLVDNRRSVITTKLLIQIVDFYQSALRTLDIISRESITHSDKFIKSIRKWKKTIDLKIGYYSALQYLYRGQQAEDQNRYGERVTFYKAAQEKIEAALKLAKTFERSDGVHDTLSFALDVIVGKATSAQKDNEFVYHEKVPALESITEQIKGVALVKPIPLKMDDPIISGLDIFARLVPMEAHEASSLYSEEKTKLLRSYSQKIEEKNSILEKFLIALQLDHLHIQEDHNSVPQELVDCCAAMSGKPDAIPKLIDLMNTLSGKFHDVESTLKEINHIFISQEAKEVEYVKLIGKRPPSNVLSELRHEAEMCEKKNNLAQKSNETLRDAAAIHVKHLKILTQPFSILLQNIPTIHQLEGEDKQVSEEMKRLADKVEEMKKQRAKLETDLRQAVLADDITQKVVVTQAEALQDLFQTELAKHNKIMQVIDQNLLAQDNIIRALTETNARYSQTREITSTAMAKRKIFIQNLLTSYEAYDELVTKCQGGIEFYEKLEENLQKILSKTKGVAKVQDEEREAQLTSFIPNLSPPSTSHLPSSGKHPKLKDYLDARKTAVHDLPYQSLPPSAPSLPTQQQQSTSVNQEQTQLPYPQVSNAPQQIGLNPQPYAGTMQYANRANQYSAYTSQTQNYEEQRGQPIPEQPSYISQNVTPSQLPKDIARNQPSMYSGHLINPMAGQNYTTYSLPTQLPQQQQSGAYVHQVTSNAPNYYQQISKDNYAAVEGNIQHFQTPGQAYRQFSSTASNYHPPNQNYQETKSTYQEATLNYQNPTPNYAPSSIPKYIQNFNTEVPGVSSYVYPGTLTSSSIPPPTTTTANSGYNAISYDEPYLKSSSFSNYQDMQYPQVISKASYGPRDPTYSAGYIPVSSQPQQLTNTLQYEVPNKFIQSYGQQSIPSNTQSQTYYVSNQTPTNNTQSIKSIDLLGDIDKTVSSTPPLMPTQPQPQQESGTQSNHQQREEKETITTEDSIVELSDQTNNKEDPLSDSNILAKLKFEFDKLQHVIESFDKKSLNGPTNLDMKWREVLELQNADSGKKSISVARCYPMKNRFPDILPFDQSRVPIPETKDDYINASTLGKLSPSALPLIITQLPLPSTLSDFWHMVYNQGIELIVSLVSDQEEHGNVYYPIQRGIELSILPFTISLQSTNKRQAGFVQRIFSLSLSGIKPSRVVIQLQFKDWGPGGVFPSPAPLLAFLMEVHSFYNQQRNPRKPVLVHCLAGVGRSGIFAILSAAIREITQGNTGIDLALCAGSASAKRKGVLIDSEYLRYAYHTLLYFGHDLLVKRGISPVRSAFDENPKGKHRRLPSQDFLDDPFKSLLPPELTESSFKKEYVEYHPPDAKSSVSNVEVRRIGSSEKKSLIADLPDSLTSLDLSTFQPKETQDQKRHIARDAFFSGTGALLRRNSDEVSSGEDPLSSLDPLWTLKK